MPKKKSAKSRRTPTLPRRLIEGIYAAEDLLDEGHPDEARDLLEELDQKYSGHAPVLELLVNAYHDLKDMHGYEWACYRLIQAEGNNPEATLGLAGGYMHHFRPALTIRTLQNFLNRWPEHELAVDARQTVQQLKNALQEELSKQDLPEDEAFELALQHEEIRFWMDHQQFRRGKQLAEKLLRRYPKFIPALNNLSQFYALEGNYAKGIEIARRVLEIEPENVHALSNLSRLLFFTGQGEEAFSVAVQLKESRAEASDVWAKKAEALSFLGDDDGMLALYEQARQAGGSRPFDENPLFSHLVAVAAYNNGRQKEARRLWDRALKSNPSFELARQNLDDLERPVGDRNAPWGFSFSYWLPEPIVKQLVGAFSAAARRKSELAVQSAAQQFLEKHPGLVFLAPHLLQRGDGGCREFVINLAGASDHPELLVSLRDFALGQRGSDQLRMKAAQLLSEKGLLPSGTFRLWTNGEWKDVLLLNFEITSEPEESHHSPAVQELAEQAFDALQERDGKRAQELLERALALDPDSPSLYNNLALAFELQSEAEKAHAMVREIHSRFPDYFFGIVGAANLATKEGDIETAHAQLEKLLQRKRLHITEFEALCTAQIKLELVAKNIVAARSWLEMWENVDPENPRLEWYRLRIGASSQRFGLSKLFSPKIE